VDAEQYRRAVAEEFEATRQFVEVRVASLYRGGHFVQVQLDLSDADGRLDETLEGAVAWWSPSSAADVLSYLPESELLNLRFVKGPLPEIGQVIRLYPPRYLDSLHALWQSAHAERFASFGRSLGRCEVVDSHRVVNQRFLWLREAQGRAFDLLQWRSSYLWGPPGTGKTTTIGCLLASVLEQDQEARVLLIANTNLAVDQALVAVDAQLQNFDLRRLCRRVGAHFVAAQYADRAHLLPNQDDQLLTEIAQLEALIPPRGAVERYASWKARHEELRDRMRVALESILDQARVVAMTTTRALFSWELLRDRKFDYVVFDESSQVPLPAALPFGELGQRVLFAGDPNQLAPIAQTRGTVFCESTLSRLDPRAPNACFLNEQSRMAPAICETISKVFYLGKLIVARDAVENAHWLTERGAFEVGSYGARHAYLIPVRGEAKWRPAASGWIREESAEQVVGLVSDLLRHLIQEDILILTPFRGQRNYLRRKLREAGMGGVRLSTVHRAQGAESNTVIFDPVQTSSRFLGEDLSLSRRLVNVALSRAKARMFLFASESDLRHPVVASIAREIGRLPESIAHIQSVLDSPHQAVGRHYLLPVSTIKMAVVKVTGIEGEMLKFEENGVERRTMLGHLRRRVGWLQGRRDFK